MESFIGKLLLHFHSGGAGKSRLRRRLPTKSEGSKTTPFISVFMALRLKSDLVGSHPLEAAYHAAGRTHEEMNRKVLTTTYGSAFLLKMDLDRQIFSRYQRPPGAISSSMLGLEAMTGSLDKIYFEDYLNDPRDSKSVCPYDMHHGMEVRNGLSKGPIFPSFI